MKNIHFFLALFFFSNVVFAQYSTEQQKKIDSLYHEVKTSKYDTTVAASLVGISEIMYVYHVDTLLPLCNKAIEICNKNLKKSNLKKSEINSFKLTMAAAYNNISYVYGNYGDINKQLEVLLIGLKIRENIDDDKGLAATLNNIGYSYKVLGDIKKAIECYDKSLKIKERIGDKKGASSTYLNMGSIYESQGEIDNALALYFKALAIQEELKDMRIKAIALNNIAYVYFQKKNYEKSFEYNFKSLQIRNEINDSKGIANSLHNIGLAYKETGKLDSALKYYMLSLHMKEEQRDSFSLPASYTNIGYLYFKKNNFQKAKTFGLKSLEIAKSTRVIHNIKEAAMLLQKIYKEEKNFKEAYKLLSLYYEIRDSIINQENKKAAIKQNLQYEYNKKLATDSIAFAKENEIKEIEIAKQKSELEAKRNQQFALFGGLFLVLLFSGFIYNRFKLSQKQKQIIEIQKNEVEEKSKEITDSITYAKRIQEAILPSRESLNETLKNGFILYKPKDIVAGDFYWMEKSMVKNNEIILFAAADCTGHGVPGALVSVVCNNALNRSVREFGLTLPGEILDKTRDLVVQEFSKSGEEVKDGMDISLCSISFKENSLRWAGANNPAWIIRDGNIIEIKPNKQPIGKSENRQPFTTHQLQVQKGDTIYIFTDGFADQFGGEKGKKFKSSQLKDFLISIQQKEMNEQKLALEECFHLWKGSLEQVDDVCVIGVRV